MSNVANCEMEAQVRENRFPDFRPNEDFGLFSATACFIDLSTISSYEMIELVETNRMVQTRASELNPTRSYGRSKNLRSFWPNLDLSSHFRLYRRPRCFKSPEIMHEAL